MTIDMTKHLLAMFLIEYLLQVSCDIQTEHLQGKFLHFNRFYPIETEGGMEKKHTNGGRKKRGPVISPGQWPSEACKAEKKETPLRTALVAFSWVMASSPSIFTGGITCSNLASFKNCAFNQLKHGISNGNLAHYLLGPKHGISNSLWPVVFWGPNVKSFIS